MALAACALLMTAGGCAQTPVYMPTEQVAAQVQGVPASRYGMPPEAPHGDVTVSSRGLAKVEARDGSEKRKMIHVSVVMSNNDDRGPWRFDGRVPRLIVGGTQLTPALVSSDGAKAGDPVITVAPGQKRTVDLYFAPPPGGDKFAPNAFDAMWSVETPERRVTERTPFERLKDAPASYSSYGYYGVAPTVAVGLGPVWWYDPLYAPYFVYPPVIHYARPYYGYGYYTRGYYGAGYYGGGYYGGGAPRYRTPGATAVPQAAPPIGTRAAPAMPSAPRMSGPSGGGFHGAPAMPSGARTSGPVR